MLTAEKVRCSPSSPCSRANALCAWLRVAPLLPSPTLRAVACALSGRDGKAGSPIEPESWICDVVARTTMSRSGCRVTALAGVQLRVGPLQRCWLRTPAPGITLPCIPVDGLAGGEHRTILPGMALRGGEVADSAVVVIVIVPLYELRAPVSGGLQVGEPLER